MLLMHGWFVGYDLAMLIVSVPATTGGAFEIAYISWQRKRRLAKEALDVALAPKQGRHMWSIS